MEVYPEYDWLPWKFEKCPKKYWHDVKNERKFMDWAGKELNVKEMSDWYNLYSVSKSLNFHLFSRNCAKLAGIIY